MVLRSYPEMRILMHKIEKEIHHYLPDYKLQWVFIPEAELLKIERGNEGRITIAENEEDELIIRISKQFIEQAPEALVFDTVKHEIAHTFSYPRQIHHGQDWRDITRALGGAGKKFTYFQPSSSFRQPRYLFRSQEGDIYESSSSRSITPDQPHLPGRYYVKDVITGQKWAADIR